MTDNGLPGAQSSMHMQNVTFNAPSNVGGNHININFPEGTAQRFTGDDNSMVHTLVLARQAQSLNDYLRRRRATGERDQQNELGQTPLHLALLNNFTEGVDFLLDLGARVDIQDKGGNLPLHLAAKQCHSRIIQRLVDAGPRELLNCRNDSGSTPLHMAVWQEDATRVLLNLGARGDIEDKDGNNPLQLAIMGDHSKTASLLLQRRAQDVNHKNNAGDAALHVALRRKQQDVAEELITGDYGANVSMPGGGGDTPLMLAVITGCRSLVECLINYPECIQSLHRCNNDNQTALALARDLGDRRIEDILRERAQKLQPVQP